MSTQIVSIPPRTLARVGLEALPAMITSAGEHASRRFIEFFTANIRNKNTRMAYMRALGPFFDWCENRGIRLYEIQPVHVAGYIEQHPGSAPIVKQHLAAIRMLFDWLVTGQVMPINPASSVRGPKYVVKKGKTPVLTAAQARQLLDSIDTSTIAGLRDRALIGVMVYSFARVSAVIGMRVEVVTNVDTSETSIAESLRLSCDVTNRETNIDLVDNILGVSTTGIALGRKADSTRALFTLPSTHRKNPYFTPKHELTVALSSLRAGDTLVLCGPPGVGKTQHAVQHAQEERHQYSMVLWASAESVQSLHQALAGLADIVPPIAETSCSTEAKVNALREWLRTEPGWLLILDNADSDDAVREIERFIPAAHNGYVLVTS